MLEHKKVWFCIASGTSNTKEQTDLVAEAKKSNPLSVGILTVNDNFCLFSDPDIIFAADRKWWNYHFADVMALHPNTPKVVLEGHRPRKDVKSKLIEVPHSHDFPTPDDKTIYHGGNSGQMAIDYLLKYKNKGLTDIVLVGYDFCLGSDNKKHWFGNHPKEVESPIYPNIWLDSIKNQALNFGDVRVWNASPVSAIPEELIPKIDLSDFINKEF